LFYVLIYVFINILWRVSYLCQLQRLFCFKIDVLLFFKVFGWLGTLGPKNIFQTNFADLLALIESIRVIISSIHFLLPGETFVKVNFIFVQIIPDILVWECWKLGPPRYPSELIRGSLYLICGNCIDKFCWIIFWLNFSGTRRLYFFLRILNFLWIIMTLLFLQVFFILYCADYALVWISNQWVFSIVLQGCHTAADRLDHSDFLNFLNILDFWCLPNFVNGITFLFEFNLETLVWLWIVSVFIFSRKLGIFFLETFRIDFLILI
jgi:hypothetical protein